MLVPARPGLVLTHHRGNVASVYELQQGGLDEAGVREDLLAIPGSL